MTPATSHPDLLERVVELRRQGVPFALATVVRSERPTSGRPGNRAVVLADGSVEGWVGGSCAQPTVRREALRALADSKPRLVRLSPEGGGPEEEGVVAYTMTCRSGGTLEVYIEPFTRAPRLAVAGESPVAEALRALAPPLGFDVEGDDRLPGEPSDTWVVVATMGERDEEAVENALKAGMSYVALVASRTRTESVLEYLRERGLGPDALDRLKAPAGLDIGAATGPEIALSILAEIVQRRRASSPAPPFASLEAAAAQTAQDPVCKMDVDVSTARWTADYQGQTYYFCAPGCKREFQKNPTVFVSAD